MIEMVHAGKSTSNLRALWKNLCLMFMNTTFLTHWKLLSSGLSDSGAVGLQIHIKGIVPSIQFVVFGIDESFEENFSENIVWYSRESTFGCKLVQANILDIVAKMIIEWYKNVEKHFKDAPDENRDCIGKLVNHKALMFNEMPKFSH